MSSFQSAQELAQTRQVDAVALLNGQCDLRGYPFRHLAVVVENGWPLPRTTTMLMAVEHLSQYGWQLVSVTKPFESVDKLVAFLRLS